MRKHSVLPEAQPTVAIIRADKDGKLAAQPVFTREQLTIKQNQTFQAGELLALNGASGKITQRFGASTSVQATIAALAFHQGLQPFSPEMERLAQQLAEKGESFPRRELRELPTFTIDGESTKDFDDAISARQERGGVRVWVHVADVAAWIRPGSPLDLEARRRGTSVYLPTLTTPMLPHALSTGVCSLMPGEQRAAVTVEMLVRDGQVRERKFYRSLIRSDARLTYGQVDQIFHGEREPGPTYQAALKAARAAARQMGSAELRAERPEWSWRISEQGAVSGRNPVEQGESHRLIEALMVLANREVAGFLLERGSPALHRSHQTTDQERLDSLNARLSALGVGGPVANLEEAEDMVSQWQEKNPGQEWMMGLVHQARLAACYTPQSFGHAGLGVGQYCHFTSPIRRYADLVCHRALLAELGAEPVSATEPWSRLEDLGEQLTQATLGSKRLERKAGDLCQANLLAAQLSEGRSKRITGRVSGLASPGVFIDLNGCEGLLPARMLQGGPDQLGLSWRTGEGRELRLGEQVRVRVTRVDVSTGRIALALSGR